MSDERTPEELKAHIQKVIDRATERVVAALTPIHETTDTRVLAMTVLAYADGLFATLVRGKVLEIDSVINYFAEACSHIVNAAMYPRGPAPEMGILEEEAESGTKH